MPPKMRAWAGFKDSQNEEKERARLVQRTRQKYLAVCKSQGRYPLSCVAAALLHSEIVLAGRQLGPDNIRILAILLVDNETVSGLNIRDNCLGDVGICIVSDMLTNNTCLTQLDVAENIIGVAGLQRLVSALTCHNCQISRLDISGNDIDYNGAMVVADLIQKSMCLQELRMNHNNIGERGGIPIGTALANNSCLQLLDMRWNHLRCKGAVSIANSLKTNRCLKTLDVSWNGFAKDGAKAIGESLAVNQTLEELDISNNRIEANGMATFMVGLRTNEVLKTLKIGQNPFNSEVAMYLLKILMANDNSALTSLDLKDIAVSDDFCAILAELRQKRDVNIAHGNVVRQVPDKPKEDTNKIPQSQVDPLNLMFEFKYEHGYRTLDLMKRMDKDRNMTIDRIEFKQGLEGIGIVVSDTQLDEIYEHLDTNQDGGVDYSELMVAEKEFGSRAKRNTNLKTRHLPSLVSSILRLQKMTRTPGGTDCREEAVPDVSTAVDDDNSGSIARDGEVKDVT